MWILVRILRAHVQTDNIAFSMRALYTYRWLGCDLF